MRTFSLILTISFLGCSCARIPPLDETKVSQTIQERIGKEISWNAQKNAELKTSLQKLLEKDLTVDSAVQIALLQNPKIQAIFYDLGIAYADLVDAGLLKNPIFDALVQFPHQKNLSVNSQFSITQNFIDLFLIPLRQKVASFALHLAHIRVTNAILDLSFEVRKTFYNYIGAQKKLALIAPLVLAKDAALELSVAQKKAGTINSLELQLRYQELLDVQEEQAKLNLEKIQLQEELTALLGLTTSDTWKTSQNLMPPKADRSFEDLEALALSKRLDIQMAEAELKRLDDLGKTKKWFSYANTSLGLSTEKDFEGSRGTGPIFQTEIPIFNYGQADRMRVISLYRQATEHLKALKINILSSVRTNVEKLTACKNIVLLYINNILPLQKRILNTSQGRYNVMSLSVYTLLEMKEKELRASIRSVDAMKEYWITVVELDRALGGDIYRMQGVSP